jgi:putative oxidoreductase
MPSKDTTMETTKRSELPIDVAILILRLALGFVFIAHGSQKLFGAFGGGGIAGTGQFFASLGASPGAMWAVIVGLVEFGGGTALAVGFLSRISAALIAIDMLVAIVIYNARNGFFVETPTGGWEINLILIAMTLAIVLVGGRRFAVDTPIRRALTKASSPLARVV